MQSVPVPSPVSRLFVALLALLLLPLTALLSAAPAHAAPGVAGGAVYDALGDPLAGVTVDALAAPAFTAVASTATSDVDGAYALTLQDGSYRLRFSKTDYVTSVYGDGVQVDVVEGALSVDGEPVEDNLLEDVTLTATAQHAVSGRVRNADDVSLAGIDVAIYTAGDDETPVDTATTDGAGHYELQVPSGIYHLSYTDAGGTYLPTWYGGAEPEDVTVTGARTLDQVTLATPPPASEFPIAGTVVDANGDPVATVGVTVTGVGATTDSGTDTTTAEGDYSVTVLPGTYRVGFAKTGFVTTAYGDTGSPATITVANNGTLSVSGSAELSGNRLDDTTLPSTPFAITGAVETTGGAGLVGITVRAFPEGSTDPVEVVDTTTSAAGGSYTLDLPIGTYDLEFADNDGAGTTYTTSSLAQVRVAQGGALSVAGSPVLGLPDVTMAVSSADTPHAVTGSVVDVNGTEVDGLTVSAVPQDGTPGANATSDVTGADGELGDHGRYRLMLKPGLYHLEVEGGADWADTTYVGQGTNTALVDVQLNGTVLVDGVEAVGGELGPTEVVGTTKYLLTGTAKEGATGLNGITVKAYAESDPETAVATTTSGADGTWTLTGVQGLVVGSYLIELSGSAGGNTYDKTYFGGATPTPVTMAQGGVALVDGSPLVPANTLPAVLMTKSSLDTPHPVTGEVTDVNGDPIAAATVSVTGGPAAGPFSTDGDGLYTLMLKPGTYTVTYAKSGFTSATYPGPGETAVSVKVELDGTVRAGGTTVPGGALDSVALEDAVGDSTLSGKVVAASGGAAISGIHVEVFPEGDLSTEARVAEATTSATGTWSVTTLKIGTYTVQFTDDDGTDPAYVTTYYGGANPATAHPVKVAQQGVIYVNGSETPLAGHDLGTTTMDVGGLDTTHPLVGAVVDANYDSLSGVLVTAVGVGGGGVTDTATSDGDGLFQLDIVPGSYEVKFEKLGYPVTYYADLDDDTVRATVVVDLNGSMRIGETPIPDGLGDTVLVNPDVKHPISGTVVDEADAGLTGITVQARLEGDSAVVATATSTSGGSYTLQVPVGTYEIVFTDNVVAAPTYSVTYFGGESPTPVKVATGGQLSVDDVNVGSLSPVTMTQVAEDVRYDLKGTVSDATYEPLDDATVEVIPVAGTDPANAELGTTGPDPVTGGGTLGDAGVYRIAVKPGKYQLRFSKDGFQTTYLSTYDYPPRTVTVTVAANGVISAPGLDMLGGVIDDVQLLLPAPVLVTAPKLTGKVLVGQVVTATLGTWNPDPTQHPDWEPPYVEWFLDGKSADRYSSGAFGQKLKIPAVAATKKLSFRFSIDDPDGERASALFNSTPVLVPMAASSVTAAFKKGKLSVTVKVPGVPKPTGVVTVYEGKKKVGTAKLTAKTKGGLVKITLKVTKGKHKLTVKYAGTATIAASKKVVRIKV